MESKNKTNKRVHLDLKLLLIEKIISWVWCRTPVIPALGRQKQMDLCEFEASLVYIVSSRTAKATYIVRPPSPKPKTKPTKQTGKGRDSVAGYLPGMEGPRFSASAALPPQQARNC